MNTVITSMCFGLKNTLYQSHTGTLWKLHTLETNGESTDRTLLHLLFRVQWRFVFKGQSYLNQKRTCNCRAENNPEHMLINRTKCNRSGVRHRPEHSGRRDREIYAKGTILHYKGNIVFHFSSRHNWANPVFWWLKGDSAVQGWGTDSWVCSALFLNMLFITHTLQTLGKQNVWVKLNVCVWSVSEGAHSACQRCPAPRCIDRSLAIPVLTVHTDWCLWSITCTNDYQSASGRG